MSEFNNPIGKVLNIFSNEWSKQVILYGPPGTSKTYSSTIVAAAFLVGVDLADEKQKKELEEHVGPNDDKDEVLASIIRDKLKGALTDSNADLENNEKYKDYEKKGKEIENFSLYELADTYLAQKDVSEKYKIVQFHPSYSYEDFVRGIVAKPQDGGGVKYEVEEKILEKFCEDNKNAEKIVLVIDEINRAPLASVLGELIYGLEYRGHVFDTPYKREDDDGKPVPLKIPKNLYIIGTMNTADRSIGSMDYAVRRRFAFVSVPSDKKCIEGSWWNIGSIVEKLFNRISNELFDPEVSADPELDMNDIKIGHTYFLGKKDQIKDGETPPTKDDEIAYMDYRLDYQIKPIYREYIKDGLINKDFLIKKYGVKENENENGDVVDQIFKIFRDE